MQALSQILHCKILKEELGVIFLSEENKSFEEAYIRTRKKEGWLYDVQGVQQLPDVKSNDPLRAFWNIRKASSEKFIGYAKQKASIRSILDIGCGNGWFTHKLAANFPDATVTGIDINKTELSLAAAAFPVKNIFWIYGNVQEPLFMPDIFDIIVFNASLQYFKDIDPLLKTLLPLLKEQGEIHITDTPWYTSKNLKKAREATRRYFAEREEQDMARFYFHHSMDELDPPDYTILYKPDLTQKLKARLTNNMFHPFPWVVIKKQNNV